jgi:hypothetical protein
MAYPWEQPSAANHNRIHRGGSDRKEDTFWNVMPDIEVDAIVRGREPDGERDFYIAMTPRSAEAVRPDTLCRCVPY